MHLDIAQCPAIRFARFLSPLSAPLFAWLVLVAAPHDAQAVSYETTAADAITVTDSNSNMFMDGDSNTGTNIAKNSFGPADVLAGVEVLTSTEATGSGRRLGSRSRYLVEVNDSQSLWDMVDVFAGSGATFRDSLGSLVPANAQFNYTLSGVHTLAFAPRDSTSSGQIETMLEFNEPGRMQRLPTVMTTVTAVYDGNTVASIGFDHVYDTNLVIQPAVAYSTPIQFTVPLNTFRADFSVTLSTAAEMTVWNFDGVAFSAPAESDFLSTLTLESVQLLDDQGQPISLDNLISDSGFDYGPVIPEPGSLALACTLVVLSTRRRICDAS